MMKGLFAAILIVLGLAPTINRASADPIVLGDYYEDIGGMGVCPLSDTCVPSFSDFPVSTAGKFITLTELSCDFLIFYTRTSTVEYLMRVYVEASDSGQNIRRRHPVTASGRTGPHSFTVPLDFKITGGPPRRPIITLKSNTTSGFGGTCTIVGKITPN